MEGTETPGQVRLSQISNTQYSGFWGKESINTTEQTRYETSFEYPLVCFGHHKSQWEGHIGLTQTSTMHYCALESTKAPAQSRLTQISGTQCSALEKHKGP